MSRKLRAAAAFGSAALCVSLAACAGGSGGGNVAAVNGQNITRAEFDNRLESSPSARQTLTQLVQSALIDQYAKNNNVQISQADVTKRENDIKSKYPPGQFDQILKQQGLTEQDVQNILRQQLVLEKAVAPQIHVSDADVRAFFAKNHAQFDKPEQVHARHILVADLKTADMIEAKLKAGGDFAALAKQYSTDPSSKDRGGDLGYFGRGQMVPQFQDAAFGAKVGTITAPVKSPFGYHIIQVLDKKPAQKATFDSVKDQIKQQLTQQQEAQAIPAFLQQLRGTAKIDVFDNRYKDAFPQVAPLPPTGAAPAPAASGK